LDQRTSTKWESARRGLIFAAIVEYVTTYVGSSIEGSLARPSDGDKR
jgi:hypothetical protein